MPHVFRPGDKVKRIFGIRIGAYDDVFKKDAVYTVDRCDPVTGGGPHRLWLTDGPNNLYTSYADAVSWDSDRFELVEAASARTAEDAALMAQLVDLMGKVHEAAVALRKSVEALQESLAKR